MSDIRRKRKVLSKFLREILEETKGHVPCCCCGPCLALSGWDDEDERRELKKEKAEKRKI